jgi:hypothetical protein
VYKNAALMICIWFNLWIVGSHRNTLFFELHYTAMLIAHSHCRTLAHKGNCSESETVKHNPHTAGAISLGAVQLKTGQKEKENTWLICKAAYKK